MLAVKDSISVLCSVFQKYHWLFENCSLRLSCYGVGKDAANTDIVDSFLTLETSPVYMKFEFFCLNFIDC